MENRSEHIDHLIARYFSGEALPEEALELDCWIDESSDNRKYFEDFRFVTSHASPARKYTKVDSEKAWEKVSIQMKMMRKPAPEASKPIIPLYKTRWFSIAASILIIIGMSIGFLIFRASRNRFLPPVTISSTDSVLHEKLTTRLQVSLNRNSSVTFVKSKSGRKNELKITGEAFVEVQHTADTALIVHAGETLIRDMGTSFNVKAYPGKQTIEVYVEAGKVSFYTKDLKGINLEQGETGIYNKRTREFNINSVPTPNVAAYSSRNFIFRKTRLSDAINALNEVYPEKIRLADPDLASYTITVTFTNESIDSLVSIMAETLKLQMRKDSSGFLLQAEK